MKVGVRKEEGQIPGGGFHYMLAGGGFHYMLAPKLLSEFEAQSLAALGFVVLEVESAKGLRLVKAAGAALQHQMEVAQLTEAALASQADASPR